MSTRKRERAHARPPVKLYILEPGVSKSQVTAAVHEMTLRRFRDWERARADVKALRKRIDALSAALAMRLGPVPKMSLQSYLAAQSLAPHQAAPHQAPPPCTS